WLSALPISGDPELDYVKKQYRDDFREAFQTALEQLSVRERNVLRHSFLYDLSIDQISAIYHVHRATAARWIAKAQDKVLAQTKRHLTKRLRLSRSECESLVRSLRSRLDITLRRFLGEEDAG